MNRRGDLLALLPEADLIDKSIISVVVWYDQSIIRGRETNAAEDGMGGLEEEVQLLPSHIHMQTKVRTLLMIFPMPWYSTPPNPFLSPPPQVSPPPSDTLQNSAWPLILELIRTAVGRPSRWMYIVQLLRHPKGPRGPIGKLGAKKIARRAVHMYGSMPPDNCCCTRLVRLFNTPPFPLTLSVSVSLSVCVSLSLSLFFFSVSLHVYFLGCSLCLSPSLSIDLINEATYIQRCSVLLPDTALQKSAYIPVLVSSKERLPKIIFQSL